MTAYPRPLAPIDAQRQCVQLPADLRQMARSLVAGDIVVDDLVRQLTAAADALEQLGVRIVNAETETTGPWWD